MNKGKNFFSLVGLEFVRLFRNKAVITLLLLFASIVTIFLSFSIKVDNVLKSLDIAIYTDNKDLSEISAMEILEDRLNSENLIFVNSKEEGVDLVKSNRAAFFLEINAETTPETIIFHYDGFSNAAIMIKNALDIEKNEYSYRTITEFLDKYGITINRSYFESLSFDSINDSVGFERSALFVFGLSAGVSVVLMFGLAYSVSRDSETNAHKIMSFMPISSTKFMWSKILTYLCLGFLEVVVLLFLGGLFFSIDYQININLIILLSLFFVISTIMLGMIFSLFKGQVFTTLCSVGVVLIPLIMLSNNVIKGIVLPVRLFLYLMPMTPYIQLFHGMAYNGVISWSSLLLLVLQSICYYIFSYLMLFKNIKNN